MGDHDGAEAIGGLTERGWHAADLRAATGTRGKPEWVTCSHAPQIAPARQLCLWSAA